jgi:hypothetical protein
MKSFPMKRRFMLALVICAVTLVLGAWIQRSLMTVSDEPATDHYHHPLRSGVVLIVQGERTNFDRWRQILAELSNPSAVTLVYGSFDSPVTDQGCEEDDGCITAFIPKTTWTEGRNQLTKVALCAEGKRGKEFTYFIYSDDDVGLDCVEQYPCSNPWERYMDHLMNKMPQTGSPVMAMAGKRQARVAVMAMSGKSKVTVPDDLYGYVLTDSYDALLNAFDRRFLPLLLPYANLPANFSWWASQAVHFSLMATCFPVSAVAPLDLVAFNPAHRDYPRGLDLKEIAELVGDNYHSYVPIPPVMTLDQFARVGGPYRTTTEIASQVSARLAIVNHTCDPLSRRFEDWKHSLGEC